MLFVLEYGADMRLLTSKQAAAILGVNDRRVTELIRAKRLPAEKVGRDWLINEKDLAKVMDRKTGRPKKGTSK